MKDIIPGDVIIEKINLISSDGSRTVTIKPQAKFISVYESVMSPTLYGEILMADSIDLHRGFPIIGEEKVEIEFYTPTLKPINIKMNVFAVENLNVTADGKKKTYTLRLCSEEVLTNAKMLINRKLVKENYNNIQDILKSDLQTKKDIRLSVSKGVDEQLITNITPFEAIDKLRLRSVSMKYLSSSYCFFEDRWGYRFVSLEEMIDNNRTRTTQKHFVYDSSNIVTDVRKCTARHIIGWLPLKQNNTVDKIQSGSLNVKVQRIDLVTGDVKEFISGNEDFATTGKSASAGTSAFNQQYGQTTSRTFLVPYNSAGNELFIAEKIGPLHSFVDKVTQNLVHAHIYGDSDIYLGDLVGATVVTGSALTEGGSFNKAAETNYLVTKIRHMIINGDRPQYTQSLELVNNSYDYSDVCALQLQIVFAESHLRLFYQPVQL
jgi:hypothetical protein